ncbi:hypothetical protein MASR1M90_17070 [Desulfovibrionales bacterium]
MVEMNVFGLALDEESQMPILILKDEADEIIFPIWIGALEAMAISLALNKVEMSRPMTHDLMMLLCVKLGATLTGVEIVAVREGMYYAELVLQTADGEKRVDCRPSDSIALALRARVPIRVAPDVIELNKTLQQGSFQEVVKGEDSEKWTEILSKYSLDDLKYKM